MRWVKALESGRYKQTVGRLRDNKGYCCLGVACTVFQKDVKGRWDRNIFEMPVGTPDYDRCDTELPRKMMLSLGITDSVQRTLIEMNDEEKKSFKEIAAVIREKYQLGPRKTK